MYKVIKLLDEVRMGDWEITKIVGVVNRNLEERYGAGGT